MGCFLHAALLLCADYLSYRHNHNRLGAQNYPNQPRVLDDRAVQRLRALFKTNGYGHASLLTALGIRHTAYRRFDFPQKERRFNFPLIIIYSVKEPLMLMRGSFVYN